MTGCPHRLWLDPSDPDASWDNVVYRSPRNRGDRSRGRPLELVGGQPMVLSAFDPRHNRNQSKHNCESCDSDQERWRV